MLTKKEFLALGILLSSAGLAGATETPSHASPAATRLVDCQLPPQVRKLAAGHVQQFPGAIVRVTAEDCRVRGGSPIERSRVSSTERR